VPKPITNFVLSKHAQKRFAERGIDQNNARTTVLRPVRRVYRFPGKNGGKVYLFEKDFPDGRNLCVVAELFRGNCQFITAYYPEE
jgi:Domain of unknown function (DUF4258)